MRIILCVLIWTAWALNQQPYCQVLQENSRFYLAPNQTRDILLKQYVKGFNISYSLIGVSGVNIRQAIQLVQEVETGCPHTHIVMLAVNKDQFGGWSHDVAVWQSDGKEQWLAIGNISHEGQSEPGNTITIRKSQKVDSIDIDACLSMSYMQDGTLLIHCRFQTTNFVWLIDQSFNQQKYSFDGSFMKSATYQNLHLLAFEQASVWVFTLQDFKLLKKLDSKSFNKSNALQITDALISQSIYITDFNYGLLKWRLSADLAILDYQYYPTHGQAFLKLTQSDVRLFIQQHDEIIEFFELGGNLKVGNVYPSPFGNQTVKLDANQEVLTAETQNEVYVYKRYNQNFQQVLGKYNINAKSMVDPNRPEMILFKEGKLQTFRITSQAYLRIFNISETSNATLRAISISSQASQICHVYFEMVPIDNLTGIYPTASTLQPSQMVPINEPLTIPISKYFEGLNLNYSVIKSPNVDFKLKTVERVPFISIYSKYPLLLTEPIDSSSFYRFTSDFNNLNIEKCQDKQTNVICSPIRTKTFQTRPLNLKFFTSQIYGCMLGFLLEDEPYTVFLEDITGNLTRKLVTRNQTEFNKIGDWAMNEQNLFILLPYLNKVEVYDIRSGQYEGSITNSLTKDKLFKPRKIQTSSTHRQLLYIQNPNNLALVRWNKQPFLVSLIDLNITTLKDQFWFGHCLNSLIVIYGNHNSIVEYSMSTLSEPILMKEIPLLRRKISQQITATLHSRFLTVELQDNQVMIVRTGWSTVGSVLLLFNLQKPGGFLTTSLQQLLLMQFVDQETQVRRIYTEIQIEIQPHFQNGSNFVQKFPIQIEVTGVETVYAVKTVLNVVNYQKEPRSKGDNKTALKLATVEHGRTLIIDDRNWFDSAVIWYHLQCDYCPDRFQPTYHAKRVADSKSLRDTVHFVKDNDAFWMLADRELYQTDLSLKLLKATQNIPESCSHLTKGQWWIILFCRQTQTQRAFFQPVSLLSDQPSLLSPIRLDPQYPLFNVHKSMFIDDRLIVLDSDIFALSLGTIRIYKTEPTDQGLTLTHEKSYIGQDFTKESTTINDFEFSKVNDTTYHMYLTLGGVGISISTITFFEDISTQSTLIRFLTEPPAFLQNYLIEGDQALQIRLISQNRESINATHNTLRHVVVITTSLAAHFEFSLQYTEDKATHNLQFTSLALIQAFNRYGQQTALNWLEVLPYSQNSTENMFLMAYYNETSLTSSIGIYPLYSVDSPIKDFQNVKGGSFIDTNNISVFSAVMFRNSNNEPMILNNLLPSAGRKSQPVINILSNYLKIVMDYGSPSSDQYILFRATNQYGEDTRKMYISWEIKGPFKWYWILLICVGGLLLLMLGCYGFRRYRLRKEKLDKEKMSILEHSGQV